MTADAPIACTLTTGDYAERMEWIAALNRTALRASRLDGTVLTLEYRATALPTVREMIRREQECCAFLEFNVRAEKDTVELTVRAPEESGASAPHLLAPFLSGTPGAPVVGASCGDEGCQCRSGGAKVPGRSTVTGATKSGAAIAIACGVCCLLPFALPAVAATSAGAFVAAFGATYWWAVRIAVGLGALGWGWVAWQSIRTGKRAHAGTVRGMVIATLVLAFALSWPFVERYLIDLIRG